MTPELLNALSAGGAGLTAVIILWLLVPVLRGQQKSQEGNTANQTALVNAFTQMTNIVGQMQVGAAKRDEQFDRLNSIQEGMNQATSQQNQKLDRLIEETVSGRDFIKSMTEEYVGGSQDTSAAIQGLDKRVEDTRVTLINKLDDVHTDVKAVPGKVIEGINWDSLVQSIADKLMPRVFDAVKEGLDDCIKVVAEQAKDLDHADKVIDNIVKPQPPDPDPPPPTPVLAVNAESGETEKKVA